MITISIGAKSPIISKISQLKYIDKGITNMLKIVIITPLNTKSTTKSNPKLIAFCIFQILLLYKSVLQ
jgi:hypothetical protein